MHLECTGLAVHVQINWRLSSISPRHIGPTVCVVYTGSQSAAHAEISDTHAVRICWLCWKLTSSFPTWKALEVTAIPEPGSQAKKKRKKRKSWDFSPVMLLLSCFLVNSPVLNLLSYTFSVINLLSSSQQEHCHLCIPKLNTAWCLVGIMCSADFLDDEVARC